MRAQRARQHLVGGRGDEGKAQRAGQAAPDLAGVRGGGIDARDAVPHVVEDRLPGGRQRRAALRPHEQRHAELLLHTLDRLRQCGLGDAELRGGAGQAAPVGNGEEVAKVVDVHKRSL